MNDSQYAIFHENKITFLYSGSEVFLDFPIKSLIFTNELCIVRIEPTKGEIFNENIFGFDLQGKKIWQIEKKTHAYEDSPYTWMGLIDGKLVISNWDGMTCEADPLTGRIIKSKFTK